MSSDRTPTSHSYFSQRLRLHYLAWGNADAPDMLLIHGSQDHCHSWDWVARELCDDYHIVVPDLRGHGDSEWTRGSTYTSMEYVYDIAQLVRQAGLEDITVIAHSMGGSIALRWAGIYPEAVHRLVAIEGVGSWWGRYGFTGDNADALRGWIDQQRDFSSRVPRRYPSLEDAFQRMHERNNHLTEDRARYLTIHGADQNEDGTFSWKFDNYTRAWSPFDMDADATHDLWSRIACPMLFVNATEGFEHRTGQDDSMEHFQDATVVDIDDAGHWVHHDQFDAFMDTVREFLAG